jgi:hypothetical protein
MPSRPARLLCIGKESLHIRCAVLQSAGYEAKSATVAEAEVLLSTEKFDLLIVSAYLSEAERNRVTSAAGETPTLLLEGMTFPRELLFEVSRLLVTNSQKPRLVV